MRTFAIASVASLALGVYTVSVNENVLGGNEVPTVNWMEAPQGQKTLPRMAESAPLDNAQRKEILYGPYKILPTQMFNKLEFAPERPCSRCFITAMEATLKFPDGREATTAADGAWLHHTVLVAGMAPMWAAGNERPTLRLNSETIKYGIDFPDSGFFINVDLMSEAPQPLDVRMSITYEYILKSQPEADKYKGSVLMWNDVGQPAAKDGVYSFSSWKMPAPVSGRLLYALGHMHDGGTNTHLFVNEKLVCDSVMRYNTRKGYGVEGAANSTAATVPAAGHGHGAQTMHISDPGVCFDFGSVKKGDSVRIEALYDAVKYPLQSHNGKKERLMGIMRLFIGPD